LTITEMGILTMTCHSYNRQASLVLCVAMALVVMSVVLMADVAAQASQAKTLDRDLEPVIVKGSQVAALVGTPVGELYVYKFDGNSLSGPIPAQVDEVTASGSYTSTDNSLLDNRDEIVFMARDAGDRPTDTSALDSFATWYEIEVSDSLDTSKKGWSYLARRSPVGVSGDYVQYTAGNRRISTSQYELGIAGLFPGFDYLAFAGSGMDILDRTKIRVTVDVLGVPITLNERDLDNPNTVLVKDGPVRVILRQDALATPGGPISEASLSTTNLAYDSLVQATASASVTLPGFLDLTYVRTSVDLNRNANGATFYNTNIPGGVVIDGSADSIAESPLSNWAQVSHTTGRLIQVVDPTSVGGMLKNYYCDDQTAVVSECDGTPTTGENGSYGDAGIAIEGDINRTFTLETWLFFLAPPSDDQDNVGTTYKNYFFNPLRAEAYLKGKRLPVFMPLIFKNSQN
jgi:hypothetical protein